MTIKTCVRRGTPLPAPALMQVIKLIQGDTKIHTCATLPARSAIVGYAMLWRQNGRLWCIFLEPYLSKIISDASSPSRARSRSQALKKTPGGPTERLVNTPGGAAGKSDSTGEPEDANDSKSDPWLVAVSSVSELAVEMTGCIFTCCRLRRRLSEISLRGHK